MDYNIVFTILFVVIAWPLNLKLTDLLKNNKYSVWIRGAIFIVELLILYKLIDNRSWIWILPLVLGYVPAWIHAIKEDRG